MKNLEPAAKLLLGKTIVGVVGVQREVGYGRLFLVFSDDTNYELFAREGMEGSKTLSAGGLAEVRSHVFRSDKRAHTFAVPRS